MSHEDNPRSIKFYVKRYLHRNRDRFAGRTVVDFPAGNGVTTRILSEIGAVPLPFDLFPEYYRLEQPPCLRASIAEGLPLEAHAADALICQEGIEHFSDQLGALKEFSRVLKPGGTLLITTPNYSNLRARLSYMLSESERFNSTMPPNEVDSIWMSDHEVTPEIYYGHIFLTGIQKLRVLARLAGFRLGEVHATRYKTSALILLPLSLPFIWLSHCLAYRKNRRNGHEGDRQHRESVYREQMKLALDRKILAGSHLMVEFVKESEPHEVARNLKSREKSFGMT